MHEKQRKEPRRNLPEYLDKIGAIKIANDIVKSWKDRGFNNVIADVKEEIGKDGIMYYSVRSNLVNGMPPKTKAKY